MAQKTLKASDPVAMVGLLVTGVWIWVRRQLRKRARRVREAAPA